MNLIGITILAPQQIQGLPVVGRYVRVKDGVLDGRGNWRVLFRGPRVLFVSPRGWRSDKEPAAWDKKEPPSTIAMDRRLVVEHWQGEESAFGEIERWPAEAGAKKS